MDVIVFFTAAKIGHFFKFPSCEGGEGVEDDGVVVPW
jgi:hypothetical protein